MSAMTNLLVKDDAATPVEFTLMPIHDNPAPFWRAAVAGVPLNGQPRLTVSMDPTKSGGTKVTAKLEVPVMETLGASGTSAGYVAPPKVAYVDTIIVTMFADQRSTDADRSNLLKMMVGLLQGASSTTATGTLTQASAGSAFNGSTAPVVQAYVDCILPN